MSTVMLGDGNGMAYEKSGVAVAVEEGSEADCDCCGPKVECPNNCSQCNATYSMTLTYPAGACSSYNGTYSLTQTGASYCGWTWAMPGGAGLFNITLGCNSITKKWGIIIFIYGDNCSATLTGPASINPGCPVGTYTYNFGGVTVTAIVT